jgi:uncharacterized protein YjbI with pentapeptide repeats
MSEETPLGNGERTLDRRGFLGAAAGVVAATGAVGAPFMFGAASAESATCAETNVGIPKARRGSIFFSFNASAWNTQELFENDFLPLMKQINCNAWEFAGNYPTLRPGITGNTAAAGWVLLGSYAKTYGFRIVGTHDGPSPTTAAALGSALTKMNAWGCNQLGAGGGYPSGAVNLPGAGTAITNPSAISAWQASAHTMNSWGQAYQTNSGAGVLGVTPFGPGVFQGTALTAGRTCARYYRHFHSEQGKWIQNTGTKYDNHYISELIYTETDPFVAYAQSDQCWLLDGLWMAGGNAPSVGLQGPGDPNPGFGKNRLVQPDLMERWQDSVFSFHIKDLGPNDQGTQVRNVGDDVAPGAATFPYGAVPWATDGSQDTVQFQKIYERFRHPECHEYLFERDGMSNTVTSNAYYKKCYVQALDMMDKLVLDRRPGVIRAPFAVPETDAEWLATDWSPNSSPYDLNQYRPPIADGAPGAKCPPLLVGGTPAGVARIGSTLRVDKGDSPDTWSRFDPTTDTVTYLWVRDEAPLPLYDGAPIGSKPECECDAMSSRDYVVSPQDSGHKLKVQVTAQNTEDSATSAYTNELTVESVTGADLGGRNLAGLDFSGLNLTGTNLRGANLRGANFTNANLTNAILQGANLSGANLTGANLSGANLQGANLLDATASGANLTGANLNGANLLRANLTGANLTNANLRGANFAQSNLTNAILTGATTTGANFTGATWSNTTCKDGSNSSAHGGSCPI